MIRPKQISLAPIAPSTNNICALQTTAGAANLLLNGAVGGTLNSAKPWLGYKVAFESAADLHTVTATITGYDEANHAQTEAIACPTSNSVVSVKYWSKITSIAVSGAIGTNMKVGTSSAFVTAPCPLDMYDLATTIAVVISGTINYDVQRAFERPNQVPARTANWGDGQITQATMNASTFYNNPVAQVRLLCNSYSTGATAKINIAQASTFSA